MKQIPLEQRIIFALDVASEAEARQWVGRLRDRVKFYKVGFQLFLAAGFPLVDWIIEQGCRVFLDLKFFDVPATVKGAVAQLNDRGISFTTVHGNDKMLAAAVAAKGELKVLAVTALTSLDEGDLESLGFRCNVEDLVLSRARRALALGCDGLISSGLEAPRLRGELGDRFLVVCPGIRPVQNIDDQKRTVDAHRAFSNGADHIVVGRPIRTAADPLALVAKMQDDIRRGLDQWSGSRAAGGRSGVRCGSTA